MHLLTRFRFILALLAWAGALGAAPVLRAADLSPAHWPVAERIRLEAIEALTWQPTAARTTTTAGGLISATVSPLAVQAGLRALEAGGTAADAAATVALTQISTQLGSVVSYAGLITVLYYDATTQQVTALDAGYDSYAGETDPLTIPPADLGALRPGPSPAATPTQAYGRQTLVPGFMAGIEALHARFGHLPFGDLFTPAITYAEEGVTVSPVLASFFALRTPALARTPEGRAFLAQSGRTVPQAGDKFRQPALARTLRAVAAHGAREMYAGAWAREFVALVRREGGHVTAADLARYTPTWTEPHRTTVFGATVHVTPLPNTGAYALVSGLHLAEAAGLATAGPADADPRAWATLARIQALATTAPALSDSTIAWLRARDCDPTPAAQLTKTYARTLATALTALPVPPALDQPRHSNAIVVVDRAGNIAALTHTINAVVWGGNGLVVGGVPLPDSAGFQQARLAHVPPGGRVPHEIIDTIVVRDGRPVLATASIGSSLAAETIRVLGRTLGQGDDLAATLAAPTALATFTGAPADASAPGLAISVPTGAYAAAFLDAVRAQDLTVTELPEAAVSAVRGTLAAIALDPATGLRTAVERPDIMVFHGAESEPHDANGPR